LTTLAAATSLLTAAKPGLGAKDPKAARVLMSIVGRPLAHFTHVLDVLQLPSWPPLLAHLSYDRQKEVAAQLVGAATAQAAVVSAPADAARLLQFVQPLMNDAPDAAADADAARPDPIDEETAMELGPVARLIHTFKSPSTDDQCRILNSAHKQAAAGAFRRCPFTLVPVICQCLALARRIHVRVTAGETVEVGVHKLLTFVATIVAHLTPLAPALALRLHLLCALTADSCAAEADAYEFMTGAFTTYEEEISDSRAQLAAVTLASATLHHSTAFSAESYDTLATKATQYSARLLKKPDQCRAIARASFLFATSAVHTAALPPPKPDDDDDAPAADADAELTGVSGREPRRVLECLQRSLKIATACKVAGMHTSLFVEALDTYLLHFAHRCTAVTPQYISSLLQLIEQQLAEEGDAAGKEATLKARAHFEATKAYIASKKLGDDTRFAEIE